MHGFCRFKGSHAIIQKKPSINYSTFKQLNPDISSLQSLYTTPRYARDSAPGICQFLPTPRVLCETL